MKVPADILRAASAVYAQLGRGPDADEMAIARALLAERAAATSLPNPIPTDKSTPRVER